ncbi:MAG: 3-methyl-2-oxobutanoate hydroxymethyltransferase [Pseudomonadota bacterium]
MSDRKAAMSQRNKVTLMELGRMLDDQEPISVLTAYDASFAKLLDQAGVDCVLVGDSLGNVIQGRKTTVPVTMDDMIYHVEAVRRGVQRAMLIADMPYMSYPNRDVAVTNAARLMQAGAAMVKLEGGTEIIIDSVRALTDLGVPVCGHLGLTPQSVHQLSGYRVQGRSTQARETLLRHSHALAEAGAAMLVLECIPAALAEAVQAELKIPIIGIGAGRAVAGQVLVLHDMLGIPGEHAPRFVRNFLAEGGSIQAAVEAYVEAVKQGRFPSDEESFLD